MTKKIFLTIIVIALLIVLTIIWTNKNTEAPAVIEIENKPSEPIIKEDSSEAINSDIDNINVDSGIDTELETIDADIKTL